MCPTCDLSRLRPPAVHQHQIRCHRPTGFWRLGRQRVQGRNAPPLAVCVGRHQKNQGPVLVLAASLRVCPPLGAASDPPVPHFTPLPQQSLNDKRKKNLFTRKFPFYKSREASEQETSDVERKYRRRGEAGGAAAGLSVRPSVRPTDRQAAWSATEREVSWWLAHIWFRVPIRPPSPTSPCGAKLMVRQRCGSADPSALCLSLALSNVVSSGCFLLFSRLC